MKIAVSAYGKFISDIIKEDREQNESIIERLCAALIQCREEVAQFKRLAHGKTPYPPTKGMEMAETVLKEVRGDA